MGKNRRGKGIRDQANRSRGECPVCKRTAVKLLYDQTAGEAKIKVCKTCRAAIKHGKKKVAS